GVGGEFGGEKGGGENGKQGLHVLQGRAALVRRGEMMTTEQFDAKLTHIEEQAAAMQERVDGYRDQNMARLFLESGWSQEELAAHLGKRWGKEVSRPWVTCHLRFGRFLAFFVTSGNKER